MPHLANYIKVDISGILTLLEITMEQQLLMNLFFQFRLLVNFDIQLTINGLELSYPYCG